MAMKQEDRTPAMAVLRVWLWLVPIAMLVAAVAFGAFAAADGRWGLLAVMVVLGVFAVGMMALHWWAMYRFGKQPR